MTERWYTLYTDANGYVQKVDQYNMLVWGPERQPAKRFQRMQAFEFVAMRTEVPLSSWKLVDLTLGGKQPLSKWPYSLRIGRERVQEPLKQVESLALE